jgi:hypothetical protein
MLFVLTVLHGIGDFGTFSDEPDVYTSSRYTDDGTILIDIYPYEMRHGEQSDNTSNPDGRSTKPTQIHEKKIKSENSLCDKI